MLAVPDVSSAMWSGHGGQKVVGFPCNICATIVPWAHLVQLEVTVVHMIHNRARLMATFLPW